MDQIVKSLNISPVLLLANAVVFLLLLGILNQIFWQPMLRHLQKRKEGISAAYETVDQTRQELERLRVEYQARLARIESEARTRIQQTVRQAQADRDRMVAEARVAAQELVDSGAVAIEDERVRVLAEMRSALDDTAAGALSRAIGEPAGAAERRLIDEYVAQHIARS